MKTNLGPLGSPIPIGSEIPNELRPLREVIDVLKQNVTLVPPGSPLPESPKTEEPPVTPEAAILPAVPIASKSDHLPSTVAEEKQALTESNTVRFVTLKPDQNQSRLKAQQQIAELLAAGWHIESMTGTILVTVLLLNTAALPTPGQQAPTAAAAASDAVVDAAVEGDPLVSNEPIPVRGWPVHKPAPVPVAIIFPDDREGKEAGDKISYAEAIADGTYTPEQLDAIADRELANTADRAATAARSASAAYMPEILKPLRAWRSNNVTD